MCLVYSVLKKLFYFQQDLFYTWEEYVFAEQNINFVEIHLKMSFFFSMIFFTILDVEKFHSGAILSEKI
jgi:hypothetical protein